MPVEQLFTVVLTGLPLSQEYPQAPQFAISLPLILMHVFPELVEQSVSEPEQLFWTHLLSTQTSPEPHVVPVLEELAAPQYVLSDFGSMHLMPVAVLEALTLTSPAVH